MVNNLYFLVTCQMYHINSDYSAPVKYLKRIKDFDTSNVINISVISIRKKIKY